MELGSFWEFRICRHFQIVIEILKTKVKICFGIRFKILKNRGGSVTVTLATVPALIRHTDHLVKPLT